MKKLFLSAISFALAASAYAIPNTFSEGDVISAEQMNENFQHLEQQLQGAIEKAVNCAAGEKIADAIANGFTNITVSGTCTENLQFSMWREDSAENGTPTGKLAPRFLKIAGADSSATIVDTSSNTESTVSVNSGTTLFMENITFSGGQYGINAQRNSNLYLSGVSVESFTEKGIRVADSAWLGIDEDGATIVGTENSTGIELVTGASGWISSVTISGVDRGLNVYGGSMVYLNNYQISAVSRGITVDNSRVLKSGDGSASIEGTSDRAVSVSHGVFTNWDGNLEIKNLSGGRGITFWMSQGNIRNLKIPDFDKTGSGWNPAISVDANSSINLENAVISGSTDGTLIQFSKHSGGGIQNSTITTTSKVVGSGSVISVDTGSAIEISDGSIITATSTGVGIDVGWNSLLRFRDSTLAGTATDGSLIGLANGSTGEIRNSTLTDLVSNEDGIRVSGGSRLNFRDSEISCTCTEGTVIDISGGSSTGIRDSNLELISGNTGVNVADSSELSFRNSTLSGSANYELVRVTRASNAIIQRGSELSHSNTSEVDIEVSNLSFLNVWDSSVNSVNCFNKGYVSADEGTVADLGTNCTE